MIRLTLHVKWAEVLQEVFFGGNNDIPPEFIASFLDRGFVKRENDRWLVTRTGEEFMDAILDLNEDEE